MYFDTKKRIKITREDTGETLWVDPELLDDKAPGAVVKVSVIEEPYSFKKTAPKANIAKSKPEKRTAYRTTIIEGKEVSLDKLYRYIGTFGLKRQRREAFIARLLELRDKPEAELRKLCQEFGLPKKGTSKKTLFGSIGLRYKRTKKVDLTDEDRRDIINRILKGETQIEVAAAYHVPDLEIRNIIKSVKEIKETGDSKPQSPLKENYRYWGNMPYVPR